MIVPRYETIGVENGNWDKFIETLNEELADFHENYAEKDEVLEIIDIKFTTVAPVDCDSEIYYQALIFFKATKPQQA